MRIGFVGLGVIGYPVAGHLAAAGHTLRVYNRTGEKAERWVAQHGGEAVATPMEAAQGADCVFSCVGGDADVEAVAGGPHGLLAGLGSGAVWVDHTTASPALARELHRRCRQGGAGFADAPVSGGQAGAENGALSIMVGAESATFDVIQPLLAAYGAGVQRIGPPGDGQSAKLVNQICVAGVIQGLAEGLAFGRQAGLDMEAVMAVVTGGAAGSWQMSHRWRSMLEGNFEFGFAVDWMRKDLAIALDEARRNGVALPATALIDQFYADVQAMGGGRWDTSSLIARMVRLRDNNADE